MLKSLYPIEIDSGEKGTDGYVWGQKLKNTSHLLEFDKVFSILEKNIKTFSGKLAIQDIKQLDSAELIRGEFRLIQELTEFLTFDGHFSFEETSDISGALKNSSIKGFIYTIDEIIQIKKTLMIWKGNESALLEHHENKEKYPLLSGFMQKEAIPEELIKRLNRVMDDDGRIFDHASDELKRIRKRKTSIREEIQTNLSKLMDSDKLSDAVQEKIVTVRDGRFVIPIKNQFKNRTRQEMQYIVHSFSKTGETAFVEPAEVIHLNNEMVEIDDRELAEIRKILEELSGLIGEASALILSIFGSLGKLESLYARAIFARNFRCCIPEIIENEAYIKLINARHPLLNQDSVPVTIEVGKSCQGIIISGPNAGGKTVGLKTAGLLSIMALSGIPIPADKGSEIGMFRKILAEIGDEQSISENLSSFSGHILSISSILRKSDSKTLVLIDEIASATEPKEGEALGRQIILQLLNTNAKFIVTTHFHGIKEIAYSDSRVKNAFVEFDEENLVPLYKLHIGGTGSSFALKVARKYGLPDSLVKSAEEFLEKNATDSEKLLKSLEADKAKLYKKMEIVTRQIEESRKIKARYEEILKEIEKKKYEADKKGSGLLRKELEDALEELSDLRADIKQKKLLDLRAAEQKIEDSKEVLREIETRIIENERTRVSELKIGDTVFVASLQKEGYIEEISNGKIKVRIGIISTMVDTKDLFEPESKKSGKKKSSYHISEDMNTIPFTIDIRGKKMEEAMKDVEKQIDMAVINGASTVSIIHGKGEGILRKAVWDFLRNHRSIRSYDYAKPEDGGQGKTIVIFK